MHKGQETLILLLLVELHVLDLLRKFVLYIWHSRVQFFNNVSYSFQDNVLKLAAK